MIPNPDQEPKTVHSLSFGHMYCTDGKENMLISTRFHDFRKLPIIYRELYLEAVSLLTNHSKKVPIFTKKKINDRLVSKMI